MTQCLSKGTPSVLGAGQKNLLLFLIKRPKEGEAKNMIPMEMREQYRNRFSRAAQFLTQFSNPGSGIADKPFTPIMDGDTSRVGAVT